MIKSVFGLFVFAVALCVWIVDPFDLAGDRSDAPQTATFEETVHAAPPDANGADRLGSAIVAAAPEATFAVALPQQILAQQEPAPEIPAPQVSRDAATIISILPTPEATAIIATAAAVAAATTVPEPEPAPEPVPVADIAIAPQRTQMPVTREMPVAPVAGMQLRTFDAPLEMTVAGILTKMDFVPVMTPTPDQATVASDPLASQLADTLAGIASVTGESGLVTTALSSSGPGVSTALETIVAEALRAGGSDADIDAAVNQAARNGEIAVPGVLVRADGRVDTQILLQGIVVAARLAQGGEPHAAWGWRLSGTDPVVHAVAQPDSLAALALAYYGDPTLGPAILRANADILPRADAIAPGQRLTIPRL